MIILDTNVISEMMRPSMSPSVVEWFASVERSRLATSVIVEAEIRAGLELLPEGRRRSSLVALADGIFGFELAGRVFPVDRECATAFAELNSVRQAKGRPLARFDGLIAATAQVHSCTLATRNVKDFADLDVDIVNPWIEYP